MPFARASGSAECVRLAWRIVKEIALLCVYLPRFAKNTGARSAESLADDRLPGSSGNHATPVSRAAGESASLRKEWFAGECVGFRPHSGGELVFLVA